MTSIRPYTVTCAACGKPSEPIYPDLSCSYNSIDRHKAPKDRDFYAQLCRFCGYAADNLTDVPKYPHIIHQREYRTILKHRWISDTCKAHLCIALVHLADEDLQKAAWRILFAAWHCDSDRYIQGAHDYRIQALQLIARIHARGTTLSGSHINDAILAVDLLRRAGHHDLAGLTVKSGLETSPDYFHELLLRYELQLLQARDTDMHTIDEFTQLFAQSSNHIDRYQKSGITHIIAIDAADVKTQIPEWFKGDLMRIALTDTTFNSLNAHNSEVGRTRMLSDSLGFTVFDSCSGDDIADGACKIIDRIEMQKALDFGRAAHRLPEHKLIVACDYDVSFSKTLAYVLLAERFGPGREVESFEFMLRIRCSVMQHETIRIADKLLARDGALLGPFVGYL